MTQLEPLKVEAAPRCCMVCDSSFLESDSSAIFVTATGEARPLHFCEECYRTGLYSGLSCEEVVELHYQYGLCYVRQERYSDGLNALHAAMRLKPTTPMLRAAALCYAALGLTSLSKALLETIRAQR